MPSPLTLPVRYTRHQPPLGAPIRGGATAARNLLSAHVANAGAGGTLFDSTRRWPGTLHGGVSWAAGPRGRALKFDGSTGYASTNLPFTTIGATYSIYLRLRVDALALQVPLSVGPNSLIVVSATDWRWQQDNGAFPFVSSAGPFAANVWYDYLITSRGGAAGQTKVYVGGGQDDNGAAAGVLQSGTLEIGRQQTGVSGFRWFAGQIDTVLVWGRELSPAEARSLSVSPYSMFGG